MNKTLNIHDRTAERLSKYGQVLLDEPMSSHTSFKTGGKADYLFYPNSDDDAALAVRFLHDEDVPYTVVGGCSNLVVGDSGIRGVVIKISDDKSLANGLSISESGQIYCEAGVKKSDFIRYVVANNFGGIEFMVGIPGCMGGGIIMNAGTYMGTFSDILKKVRYINVNGKIIEKVFNSSHAHYRDIGLDEECVLVLGGYFQLPVSDNIEKVKQTIDEINADRKMKHPIEFPSAGSVFKNPEGHASWKLVNDSGLKGYSIGGAQVSEKHTNFIINKGGATSAEIRGLVEYVRNTVREKYDLEMHTEIRMVGEFH